MKSTDTHTYESTLTGEAAPFRIEAGGKIFGILLERLYTDKVRAVIRELCSNALDSHVAAGIGDIPFDVHLPNMLNPTFRVRDYGTSMDHETIMGLYATVGGSTKDDSNDFVGMLGLGSKSPFAVTDSFTAIARLDGRKRTYLAAMGADGVPVLQLLMDEEADEAQGFEVVIPVERGDFREWAEKIKYVAVGFDPAFNVDGEECEAVKPVYMASDASFAVYDKSAMPEGADLYVRQGCVLYPVTEWTFRSFATEVVQSNHCVVLDVPIGDVAIVPSREALSLDEPTKRKLTSHLNAFKTRVELDIEDAVADAKNLLEATRAWYGGDNKLSDIFKLKPTFRGDPVTGYLPFKGGRDWEPPMVTIGKRGKNSTPRKMDRVHYDTVTRTTFVIKRTTIKVVRQAKRYDDFVALNHSDRTPVIMLTDPAPRMMERMMSLLGVDRSQFINLGDLPDPGPAPSVRRAQKGLTGVYAINGHNFYDAVEELDLDDDFVWVEVSGRMSKSNCSWAHGRRERLTQFSHHRPLYAFTEKAAERWKPAPEKALDVALAAAEKAARPKLIAQLADHYVAMSLGEDMCELAGLPHRRINSGRSYAERGHEQLLGSHWTSVAQRIANHRTEKVKARYPMMFRTGYRAELTGSERKVYMNLVDTAQALMPMFFAGMIRLAHSR